MLNLYGPKKIFIYRMLTVICIALIGVSAASSRTIERNNRVELLPPTLNNSAILDPEGTFRLDWEVIYDQPDNPDLIFELHGATRGWMSIKFGDSQDRMLDYFFGAYDSDVPMNSLFVDKHCLLTPGHSCEDANGPTEDTRNDYRLKAIEYGTDPNPFTKLRIERRANTGDANQDLIIQVN